MEKTKIRLETRVRARDSIEVIFIIAVVTGAGQEMGRRFAKKFYNYIARRIRNAKKRKEKKPDTQQEVEVVETTTMYKIIIEEHKTELRRRIQKNIKNALDNIDENEEIRERIEKEIRDALNGTDKSFKAG